MGKEEREKETESKIIQRGWDLQHWFENKINNIPVMRVETFFLFTSLVLILMSGMLYFYCVIKRINIFEDISFIYCPIQYFVLGLAMLCGYIFKRIKP